MLITFIRIEEVPSLIGCAASTERLLFSNAAGVSGLIYRCGDGEDATVDGVGRTEMFIMVGNYSYRPDFSISNILYFCCCGICCSVARSSSIF